jgi:hypothetical protein
MKIQHGGFTKTIHQCVIITSANNVYKHKNDITIPAGVPGKDLLRIHLS